MRFCMVVLVAAIAATSSFGEEVVKSFPAPGGYYAYGLTFDGTDLWCGELLDGKIYRVDTASGAVLDSFPGPNDDNHGLAWDGTYLWVATSWAEGRSLYRMTTDGTVVDSIPCPTKGSLPYANHIVVYYKQYFGFFSPPEYTGIILDIVEPAKSKLRRKMRRLQREFLHDLKRPRGP